MSMAKGVRVRGAWHHTLVHHDRLIPLGTLDDGWYKAGRTRDRRHDHIVQIGGMAHSRLPDRNRQPAIRHSHQLISHRDNKI